MKNFAAVLTCLLAIAACTDRADPDKAPYLLTTPIANATYVWMLGLNAGELIVWNGCVALRHNATSHTLVFPPNYTLEFQAGNWHIKDSFGQEIGAIGDQIEIGGGETNLLAFDNPEGCKKPYWKVTPRDRREMVPPGLTPPPVPS